MMSKKPPGAKNIPAADWASKQAALLQKAETFVRLHWRLVEDFERSLERASNFLNLARVGMEKEPQAAHTMLQQIEDIGLLPQLNKQFEIYESVADLLEQQLHAANIKQQSKTLLKTLLELRERYLAQLREAENQQQLSSMMLEKLQAQ